MTDPDSRRAYRERNREQIRAYRRAYKERNREKVRAYRRAYKERNREKVREYRRAYKKRSRENRQIVGLDGEGLTVGDRHYYCYLAAWDSGAQVGELDADWSGGPRQLSTEECLDFVLGLPAGALIIGFSLGYDYTKWLQDMPAHDLYLLCHPEERIGRNGRPYPISFGRYKLDMLQGRLRVSVGGKSRVVWDIWRFFQGSFLSACKAWGVLAGEEYELVRRMKSERSDFSRENWDDVKRYCGVECRRLAELGARLLQAHREAGIALSAYFGAGSTGGAMLEAMGARSYMATRQASKWRPVSLDYPPELTDAIARAFFGGRFELSRVGPVERRVWSYDIASAYPYQFVRLPCLVHGRWRLVRAGRGLYSAITNASAAVVRYRLPQCDAVPVDRVRTRPFYFNRLEEHPSSPVPWGPFPFRSEEGLLLFPVTSGGGWVWRDEFLAGMRHWPNVEALSAWVYETDCDCPVFRDRVPEYYRERLRWGKDGRGIVLKLGCNSCPGKCAQSKGAHPPYQCFAWAGMVNSGTRAQLLEAIACVRDRSNIIASATDGVLSLEPLTLPKPRDTGTLEAARAVGKGALGEWEHDPKSNVYDGMHLIRPGVLFPLERAADMKQFRARGIGKKILQDERDRILQLYRERGPEQFELHRPMFWGMRSCLRRQADGAVTRDAKYGNWAEAQPVKVSYAATPKRPLATPEGALHTWALGPDMHSEPYGPAVGLRARIPEHVQALEFEKDLAADQPDRDDDLPEEQEF